MSYQDKLLHNRVQEFKSNAKLITAAPDLLNACIAVLNSPESSEYGKI